MNFQTRHWLVGAVMALATLVALPAQAGDNDLVLSRFGNCNQTTESECSSVDKNTEAFRSLTRDLGQVFAPRFLNSADTLGEAGFAFNMMTSMSFIPNGEDYWQEAVEDQRPPDALMTAHLQMRKGLPFSFELAGDMSYMLASEMFNLGGQIQWALHEGFYYFPEIAVRGTFNNVMGASDLNLMTAGWDISTSKEFDVGGVMAIAPFIGYQQLHVIASSRLLNAYPQDPRPPQFDDENPDRNFAPEFVFGQQREAVNRFFLGSRLKVWMLNFGLEAVYADDVMQFTAGGGFDF